jgi:hypothetical protein
MQLLIRCLVNPSTDHDKAIGESCIGIVFLATRHATVQTDLCSPGLQRSMRIANYVFPDHIRSAGYPNLPNLKSNTESINRQFLKFFSRMPPTLCVVNLYRIRPRQLVC